MSNQSLGREQNLGLIHIYCGGGKGKTSCGMGLCARAAGAGYRVLIYQFLKSNKSSERNILEKAEGITFLRGLESEKFTFAMNTKEKQERIDYYKAQFHKAVQKAENENYDVLFLDEVIYAIGAGMFDEALLVDFLKNKPPHLEVILTGQNPSEQLTALSDYVSEIRKIKHPYDSGTPARMGIEK